ncbi:MAG: 2-amino-4-hydroxy-6-hydroxymethyldihydropteridine diphosphokinase [Bacteroidetes bacterium]|nr:2-amino-4-hydroxy-6-hydroxymethyldihydropteridine diphosphokinase [Bacteroidota bacterium]
MAYIGIGSNKGDRRNFLDSAIDKINLDRFCKIDTVSPIYETKPIGYKDQGNFLNAVIKLKTDYSPSGLFECLNHIEKELGRNKTFKWGPREIDLDILLYNDLIYTDKNITIPHIGITERDFVLIPLSEIEPELIHPVIAKKISEIELPDTDSNIISKSDINILIK